MKKIIIIAGCLLFAVFDMHGQTCNATGAQINSSLQVVKNIKTDFGAQGNGVVNDHAAFEAAAALINQNGGNIKLIIPDGIYLIGKQIEHKENTANEIETVYQGIPAMYLNNISNVTIQGSKYTKIVYENSLKFGTFELSEGLPPGDLNLYNPSCSFLQPPPPPPSVTCTTGINYSNEYKYCGTIGTFLHVNNAINLEVKDLEVNGNSSNYILGGNWGLGPRPIELRNSFGFFLFDIKKATFSNLRLHHFGGDNFYLGSNTNGQDIPTPVTNNVVIDRLVSEYAGRQAFTWSGGENICVTNSTFNHSARKQIITSPATGLDIEPELVAVPVCRNSFFANCEFGFNAGQGLTTGQSIDNLDYPNPIPPDYDPPPGYTYNHYFSNCKFIGKYDVSARIYTDRVTFDGCEFYGEVKNHASPNINTNQPIVYKNSLFSDCYNGSLMINEPPLMLEKSYNAQFLDNTFERYSTYPTGDSYVFFGPVTGSCTTSNAVKPLYQGNNFYFYPAPPLPYQIVSNPRHSRFINNHFYSFNSPDITWGITFPCPPNGEGNSEPNGLGTGVIYHNDLTVSPQCTDQLVCERDIYTSNNINNSEFYRASSFIYTDSKIDLGNTENVKYQSAESINMNPGFESVLNGSAYIDLYIAPCSSQSGRTTNEGVPKVKGMATTLGATGEKQSLAVYPNPSENDFIVELNNLAGKRVEYIVADALGHIVERNFINMTQTQSSTFRIKSIHKAGIYFLTINFGDRSETKKLIKL
ncbi:MAG: T9SS type A sorting domain-containing protein [Ferruginibacter sp.]